MRDVKDSVDTEADDQYGTDQAGDHEGAALSDKWGVEYVFQNQSAKVNNGNYHKNIKKGAEKIVADMLQNAV